VAGLACFPSGCTSDDSGAAAQAPCTPGRYECVGDVLQVCNASGAGWDYVQSCPPGSCVQGAAQCGLIDAAADQGSADTGSSGSGGATPEGGHSDSSGSGGGAPADSSVPETGGSSGVGGDSGSDANVGPSWLLCPSGASAVAGSCCECSQQKCSAELGACSADSGCAEIIDCYNLYCDVDPGTTLAEYCRAECITFDPSGELFSHLYDCLLDSTSGKCEEPCTP
jgi:hypothetical protein